MWIPRIALPPRRTIELVSPDKVRRWTKRQSTSGKSDAQQVDCLVNPSSRTCVSIFGPFIPVLFLLSLPFVKVLTVSFSFISSYFIVSSLVKLTPLHPSCFLSLSKLNLELRHPFTSFYRLDLPTMPNLSRFIRKNYSSPAEFWHGKISVLPNASSGRCAFRSSHPSSNDGHRSVEPVDWEALIASSR